MEREIELRFTNLVKKIVREAGGSDSLVNSEYLERDILSLGITSTLFIKLVVEIENEFYIAFEDEDLNFNKFKNLKDMILYIENKMSTED